MLWSEHAGSTTDPERCQPTCDRKLVFRHEPFMPKLYFQTKTPRDIDPRAVNMRREITRVICLGHIAIDIVRSPHCYQCWLRTSLDVFVILVLSYLQLTIILPHNDVR